MEARHPLATYRADNGLTQEALGEKLGVTGVTIWRWENGKRTPSVAEATRVARITNVPVTAILGLEGAA